MADAADDRDVAKSVRPVGPQAIPSRSGDAMRRLAFDRGEIGACLIGLAQCKRVSL
jgi:hypothetical protein